MSVPFHRWMGLLGRGDLHPGGADASRLALEWLGPANGGSILEMGAGMGLTSARLRDAGWRVTAVEPDPGLGAILAEVSGIETIRAPVEQLSGRTFDAMIAESVLYALDVRVLLPRLRAMLRPGGGLVVSDMVWTERASPPDAERLHVATMKRFGIACASRERWTWEDWRRLYHEAGFVLEQERRLGDGSPGGHTQSAPALDPMNRLALVPSRLRHRLAMRSLRTAPGWLESWMALLRVG